MTIWPSLLLLNIHVLLWKGPVLSSLILIPLIIIIRRIPTSSWSLQIYVAKLNPTIQLISPESILRVFGSVQDILAVFSRRPILVFSRNYEQWWQAHGVDNWWFRYVYRFPPTLFGSARTAISLSHLIEYFTIILHVLYTKQNIEN